jgi:hypothetical protein
MACAFLLTNAAAVVFPYNNGCQTEYPEGSD